MPPRFIYALGLSGLSSRDLGCSILFKVAEIFIDATQVHVCIRIIGFELQGFEVDSRALSRLSRSL